jgi:hypothetical protein
MRVAHAGWFGSLNVNNVGYTIDVDPNGNNGPLISKGRFDGYAAALVPTFPTGVQNQVTLVIDNNSFVTEPDYAAMIDAYYLAIADSTVIPRTGKTALNAVFFGTPDQGLPGGSPAVEVMPWTVIDNLTTAALFADRLRNLARWDGQVNIDEGLDVARDSHERAAASMGLDACYHVLGVSANRKNYNYIPDVGLPDGQGAPDLHDAVFGPPGNPGGIIGSDFVDQIDGFAALPEITKDYFTTYMIASPHSRWRQSRSIRSCREGSKTQSSPPISRSCSPARPTAPAITTATGKSMGTIRSISTRTGATS